MAIRAGGGRRGQGGRGGGRARAAAGRNNWGNGSYRRDLAESVVRYVEEAARARVAAVRKQYVAVGAALAGADVRTERGGVDLDAVGGEGLAAAVGLEEGAGGAGGALHIGGAGEAGGLAAVALPRGQVVAGIALRAVGVVPVAVVAVGRLAQQAGRGEPPVGGRTALARTDTALALVAVQILALDALVVDVLVAVEAGEALAAAGVGRTPRHVAQQAYSCHCERVIPRSREVAGGALSRCVQHVLTFVGICYALIPHQQVATGQRGRVVVGTLQHGGGIAEHGVGVGGRAGHTLLRPRVEVVAGGAGRAQDAHAVGGAGRAPRRPLLAGVGAEEAVGADESAEGVAGSAGGGGGAGEAVAGAGGAAAGVKAVGGGAGGAGGGGGAGGAAGGAGLAEREVDVRGVVEAGGAGEAQRGVIAGGARRAAGGAHSLAEEVGGGALRTGALRGDAETAIQLDALPADLEDIGPGLAGGADEGGPSHLVAALLAADVDWSGRSGALQAVLEERVVGVAGEAGGAGVFLRTLAVLQAGRAPLPVEEVRTRTALPRRRNQQQHRNRTAQQRRNGTLSHVINYISWAMLGRQSFLAPRTTSEKDQDSMGTHLGSYFRSLCNACRYFSLQRLQSVRSCSLYALYSSSSARFRFSNSDSCPFSSSSFTLLIGSVQADVS